ncbi:hypothetical protein Dimus_034911 [Dionaea muscipula]
MATGWVKSLQCGSRAAEDVYSPEPKPLLPTAGSCRRSVDGLKDVIIQTSRDPHRRKHRRKPPRSPPLPPRLPQPSKTADEVIRRTHSGWPAGGRDLVPLFPALSELPEGHPSRNVVEIIFQTRWGNPKTFPGRVEMVFKIQSQPRTVARFEDYRETVKRRAGSGQGPKAERCLADGNEMMRFHCVGPMSGVIGVDAGGICAVIGGKGAAGVCTYDVSGAAHESTGGGRGMRAMLVCRVIAGRVWKRFGVGDPMLNGRVGFDSVSREDGELLVFDSRAVLPCFLVIYTL